MNVSRSRKVAGFSHGRIHTLAFLLIGFLWPLSGIAQISSENLGIYLIDSQGDVVKSDFGLCWRTGSWTPKSAEADRHGCECDRDLLPRQICSPQAAAPAAKPSDHWPIAAPAPVSEKISLETEPLLFDFGKADLRPASKEKLVSMIQRAKSFSTEVILIMGHTDRLESNKKTLSNLGEKRAQAVETFLISMGIDARTIYKENKFGLQPVTGTNCNSLKGKKANTCLEPDRRVDIEIIGTRSQLTPSNPSYLDVTACRNKCRVRSEECASTTDRNRDACLSSTRISSKKCESRYRADSASCSAQRFTCASDCR
jgi:OOP family OmpA-OmpF porin